MEQLERVAQWDRYQNYELIYDSQGQLKDVAPKAESGDD